MKIRLRVNVLESLQKEKGWNDSELIKKMGIARSTLWRIKLPESHQEHCYPGQNFITGVLRAFPEKTFDDLFFLSDVCSCVHINKSTSA